MTTKKDLIEKRTKDIGSIQGSECPADMPLGETLRKTIIQTQVETLNMCIKELSSLPDEGVDIDATCKSFIADVKWEADDEEETHIRISKDELLKIFKKHLSPKESKEENMVCSKCGEKLSMMEKGYKYCDECFGTLSEDEQLYDGIRTIKESKECKKIEKLEFKYMDMNSYNIPNAIVWNLRDVEKKINEIIYRINEL